MYLTCVISDHTSGKNSWVFNLSNEELSSSDSSIINKKKGCDKERVIKIS